MGKAKKETARRKDTITVKVVEVPDDGRRLMPAGLQGKPTAWEATEAERKEKEKSEKQKRLKCK